MAPATTPKDWTVNSPPDPCDLLILMILPEEWESFQRVFPEATKTILLTGMVDGANAEGCEFELNNYRCIAATLNRNSVEDKIQGKVPAAVFATRLLSRYAPRYVVNIGIACRVDDSACSLGGVVIANSIVDLTGNGGVEDDVGGKLKFSRANSDLHCDDARWSLLRLKASHAAVYARWHEAAGTQLAGLPGVTSALFCEGKVVTGEFLTRSRTFHEVIKASGVRTAKAYEMEAYAIAQVLKLLTPSFTPKLIVLKGLSDDGDGEKRSFEEATKGRFREAAGNNAFRMLRAGLEIGAWGEPLSPGLEETLTPDVMATSLNNERGLDFPLFSPADINPPGLFFKKYINSEEVRKVQAAIAGAGDVCLKWNAAELTTRETIAQWLNRALQSDYWEKVYYRSEETDLRLGKIVREACRPDQSFREHSRDVVNRLLLERELPKLFCRKTPIVSCLVEDTGMHRALETYKKEFQRINRAVIDFDALPLADLYSASQDELYGKRGNYDLIFHYHLGANQFFKKKLVSKLENVESLARGLIEAVERECCYVDGNESRVTIPINANSMVLLVNEDLFSTARGDYREKTGEALKAPTTWPEVGIIVDYFRKYRKESAFLPQGRRDGDALYFDWCNVAYNLGGGVFRKQHGWETPRQNSVIVDSQDTIAATHLYKKLYDSCPADVAPSQLDPKAHLIRFLRGDIAMAFCWTDMLHELYSQRGAAERFKTYVMPGERSMIGGGVCCISKKSRKENKRVAETFVLGLLETEMQATLTTLGWCSGFASVYNDKRVQQLPYAEVVHRSLARGGHMIEAGPKASQIREIVGIRLEKIMTNQDSVEHVLQGTGALLRAEFCG